MQRRIVAFHQDMEQHWVADLECGHTQHVRHEPPLMTRLWVLEAHTRAEHLGTLLDCLLCDAQARYDDARQRGLCHEGAVEAARYPAGGDEPTSTG